ncbi:hypothetical protein ACVWXO_008371 [Bradyrhizobium sp. LM2.7]
MADVGGAVAAFVLGGIGWVVTSFVGQPFRNFFDLRREVIHKSVLYDNVRAAQTATAEQVDLGEDEQKRLGEAQDTFRDLAARMRAFALNERFAVRLVSWRYDPMAASTALLAVSNTLHSYGKDRAAAKSRLEEVLQFQTVAD